jgi:hypothetical protein
MRTAKEPRGWKTQSSVTFASTNKYEKKIKYCFTIRYSIIQPFEGVKSKITKKSS